jgi:hypothetical protein
MSKDGYTSGSIVEASEIGYMISDLFVTLLKVFVACVRQNPGNIALLVLDGHTTLSKNPVPRYGQS